MRNAKKLLALALAGTMAMSAVGCGSSSNDSSSSSGSSSSTGSESTEKQTVELTLWGAEEDQELLQTMVDSFIAEYGDKADITITLGAESESTAKDTVLADVEAAADVFAFASDQINDLVAAGALQQIDTEDMDATLEAYAGKTSDDIKSANAEGSVSAATVDGALYGFPMSADNGYFLYYDSTILSEEDVQSMDKILEVAAANGKQVGMTLASGWYNASFFYGAGFTTGLNSDGTTAIDWNGSADYTGVEVCQGILDITGNSAFMPIADGDISNQIASGSLCAVVSGTWDAAAAEAAFGDGYAATKLPTYTVAGDQVQMGSVAGFKLVGVNAYSENVGWATLLAEWITNEENQALRFAERQIGPSNSAVAASDDVQANIALAALSAQSAYGVVQIVGGNFWDPTATFGELLATQGVARDDADAIQTALDEMVAGVTASVE